MTKRLPSILGSALLLVTAACGEAPKEKDDKDEEDFPEITAPSTLGFECDPESVVTWENFAEGWITRQCTSCHSVDLVEGQRAAAPIGVDFNTYEMVRSWANNMTFRAAFDNETMPPAGGPYPYDRVLFGEWLACQAPRESDTSQ